jgi:hypothetical protein
MEVKVERDEGARRAEHAIASERKRQTRKLVTLPREHPSGTKDLSTRFPCLSFKGLEE